MKWLITIWAFYMLALGMAPCGDAYNSCEDQQTITRADTDHSHSEDAEDNCTPFCYCSCCNANIGAIHFNFNEILQPPALFVANKIVIRDCSFKSSYSGNIWQPPRA